MGFLYSVCISIFALAQVNAITFTASEGVDNRVELKIMPTKLLPPADLVVTEITFVSIYFDVNTKTYLVKVAVSIRNTGAGASGRTQLEAYSKPSDEPASWRVMGSAVNIPVIKTGGSFKSEFSFKESVLSVGTVSFDFRVKVDPRNIVIESDKTNNYSKSILINPRAY